MSYRARTMLLVVVIELLLAGFWLLTADMPGTTPDAPAERGRIIGMVMGVILGISPLLYLMARKNDRKKAEKSTD
jgi:hypothetical protein